jgi:hypothetical protein
MASLRAKLAELERRMLALEARQLAWRHDAASKAGAPDSAPEDTLASIMSSTHDMMAAIAELREKCRGRRLDQIDIYVEEGVVNAVAYLDEGPDTTVCVTFDQPVLGFRRSDCKKLFEEALHVE